MRPSPIGLLFVLAATPAAGCSCAAAHELGDGGAVEDSRSSRADAVVAMDAVVAVDAFVAPDAMLSGAHFFTLEPARVDLIVLAERCAENQGATAMLRVTTHFFSSCDTPGPIDVTLDPTAHTIAIAPHVWLEHGRADCRSVGAAYTRDVPVVGLTAGMWTITGSFTPIPYRVATMPPTTCPAFGLGTIAAGSICRADCECARGLSCLAIRGDVVCQRLCADPCETLGAANDLALSCPRANACTNDPNLGWICAATTTDTCSDTRACPAGMTCSPATAGPRQCVWATRLDSGARHLCTTESDCGPGLDCVQRVDGRRACEVRCTTSDMACPNTTPHACMMGNWVCEWLGD